MSIIRKEVPAKGLKFYVEEDGKEIARTYLYILSNDPHEEPFGLMEDVFVHENHRKHGYGSQLVKEAMRVAQEEGCYKLICTARDSKPHVHRIYLDLGFEQHGLEFRMDFTTS